MTLAIGTPSAAFTFRVDPEQPHYNRTIRALFYHYKPVFDSIATWFATHVASEYMCDIKPDLRIKVTRDHNCLWVHYCPQSTVAQIEIEDECDHPIEIAPLPLRALAKLNPSAETIAILAKLSPDDI